MSNVVRELPIVRRLASFAAALTVAVLAIATASVSASYAIAPEPGSRATALPSPLEPFPSLQAAPGSSPAEVKVLTDLGISPAVARRALELQTKVAEAHLVSRIEDALGSSYAGVWFEPTKAQFDVGVVSGANRKLLARVIASSGLKADVVEAPVHATLRALVATQGRWSRKVAALLGATQTTTAIDVPANAVSVTISSSVSSAQRVALRREAAAEGGTVVLKTAPRSQFRVLAAKKVCESPFVSSKAFCEETITAGVKITVNGSLCTAGPMLIKGTETFMLTAGHCIGGNTPAGGSEITLSTTSAYPINGTSLEIGSRVKWYFNSEREVAEVKVLRPGKFTEPLPTPVPALVTEWQELPRVPHSIAGVKAAELPTPRQVVCHDGQTSGEKCGLVLLLDSEFAGVKFLVETDACAQLGDSGGPFFFRNATTKELYMMGTDVSGTETCGTPESDFEPLLDAGRVGLGTLAAFKDQRLLTKLNETRKPRIRGAKGEPLVKKAFTSKSGATTFETVAGRKITCSAESGSGEASALSSGTTALNFTGCEGFFAKCKTPGAAEGEIKWSGKYSLVFINGSEDKVGAELEPAEAAVECISGGTVVEKLKTRGKALAPATPINEEVVPPKKFTLAFAQTKGVQEPIEYENETGGKVRVTLETEGSGTMVFAFEQTGIASTGELLFEETAEIEA